MIVIYHRQRLTAFPMGQGHRLLSSDSNISSPGTSSNEWRPPTKLQPRLSLEGWGRKPISSPLIGRVHVFPTNFNTVAAYINWPYAWRARMPMTWTIERDLGQMSLEIFLMSFWVGKSSWSINQLMMGSRTYQRHCGYEVRAARDVEAVCARSKLRRWVIELTPTLYHVDIRLSINNLV